MSTIKIKTSIGDRSVEIEMEHEPYSRFNADGGKLFHRTMCMIYDAQYKALQKDEQTSKDYLQIELDGHVATLKKIEDAFDQFKKDNHVDPLLSTLGNAFDPPF